VDDNATNRRLLEEILQRWGMQVVTTENAASALRLLRQAKEIGKAFALIVTDLHMPVMDGFGLLECIKQEPELSDVKVVMLSSASQLGDAEKCRQLGVATYLIKPIRQPELHQAILAALDQPLLSKEGPVERRLAVDERQACQVLVAEDNVINQKVVTRLLEKRGYHVTIAEDGHAALRLLQARQFDLVLMDVQMPNLDGLEATRLVREKERETGRHMPIIATTAHALKGDEERCYTAGMDAYLTKPLRADELFAVIESYLPVSS
jgi:CheY-like chemotaxis protein